MITVLVIAPNVTQFDAHVEEKIKKGMAVTWSRDRHEYVVPDLNRRYRHIRDPEQMRGYHGVEVEFAGNWQYEMSPKVIDEVLIRAKIARLP